ncbi:hypothetical protein [Nonomuraea sp. SYSU D8015]|uniref:hypothetical protein n=1 Tax=Nonomuraea sp. SYSU D8015 TaxID=2593644 RepID=UPI001660D8AF|nr:hypothetical protein [Nonomuraea sp. SYSU D8015]
MTTTTTHAPDRQQHTVTTAGLLTACDVLAIEKAIVNVAYYGITPDAADRQALAVATYWPGCKMLARLVIRRIFDGYPLPLNQRCTQVLLDLIHRLPAVSEADEDAFFATHTVAGVTKPADPESTPESMLTPHDVLDITAALRNVTAADCTSLTPQDRQALALLTYWDKTPPATRIFISWLADPTRVDVTLPLPRDTAAHLLTLTDLLPEVSEEDVDAWLADRDTETPCVIDQIITALASMIAMHVGEPGAHLLNGAIQTVIRIGKPDVPLSEVPDVASAEIVTAIADLDADGLLPEPQPDPALWALAAHNADYGNSGSQRTMLIAAILAANGHATGDDAVELARTNSFDERVREAGRIADDMVKQIRRNKLTAIDDAPTAVAL